MGEDRAGTTADTPAGIRAVDVEEYLFEKERMS